MIDWNVRAGDLLVLAGFAGTGFVYAFKSGRLAETIEIMEKEIEKLQESYKMIALALTTMAVQKVQIERMDRDIIDMKHGRGFISERDQRRTSVEGEYP